MATLTKSWQSLKSVTLYSGISFHLDAKYSSQSTANNTTTVQFRLRSAGNKWRTTSGTAKFTGAYTDSKSCATYPDYIESGDTIISISKTVTHNADGTKSLSIGGSVQAYIDGASRSASISKQTVTIPKINRLATITSASDFTDEENPTLEFTNPAGFNVYPYLNFYDDAGNRVYQLQRRSSSATSPYTWNITDEERLALYKATNKQQSYKVSVGVDTFNGTTSLGYNSKAQKMTYVNAVPSQSTTFTESNQKVIDVLGTNNAEVIIQNVSQLKLTSTPSVKKEATVSKISFEHNNISVDDSGSPYEYTFTPVNSKFKVTIHDSRKYSTPTEYTKAIVEYFGVNIDQFSFKRENPTSSNIVLNAQIRYKQATFGSNDNAPTIKWKLGTDGELKVLTTDDYTIDLSNNKIIISNLLLDDILPYTSEGRLYLYVNDLLTEDTENEVVLRGIPTCDMGEHDFQVNGELYIADENRENKKEIRDLFFPIGSTYVTSKNENPANYLGGTWELIDKEFKSQYKFYEDDSSVFPYTNISKGAIRANYGGHTINISFNFDTTAALSDTTVKLTTLNYAKLGIVSTPGSIWIPGFSDGGNSAIFFQLGEDGSLSALDIVPESSVPANSAVTGLLPITLPPNRMLDEFCDKFYWKRTA